MISINDLKIQAGNFKLSIQAKIADKEYFVLLGMTGSGKTLLLECLCGLRRSLSGSIVINGRDVTHTQPKERQIGYVPQEGALFNHLTVEDNITFGPRVAGEKPKIIKARLKETAQMLGISYLLGRYTKGLSGGERQRVALARAIITRPSMLLLDEPVCALDEFTRETVCRELKRLQRELGIPVIHVCHSFEEASLLADRIGLMQNGQIAQTGTIENVQSYPVNQYVARMLKLENLFTAESFENHRLTCNGVELRCGKIKNTGNIVIRPWQISIADEIKPEDNCIEGTISEMYNVGPVYKVSIEHPLPLVFYSTRREAEEMALNMGKKVKLVFPQDAVYGL